MSFAELPAHDTAAACRWLSIVGIGEDGIDGLTPLPEDFWPPKGAVEPWVAGPAHVNKAEEKLIKAFSGDSFNPECPELKRINKLEIPSRHMVLAVDEFKPVDEGKHKGKVLLQPFSLAMFGKGEEINTIQSQEAYLTFDRPIKSISEVGKAKIGKLDVDAIQWEPVQLLLARLRYRFSRYRIHVFDIGTDVPIPAVAAIAGHVAFYPDKADISVERD